MQAKQLQTNEAAAIQAVLGALSPFFDVNETIAARSVQTFLLVAQNEGQLLQEYARQAQMTRANMSRNLLDIGNQNRRGQPGYGLVAKREHIPNRRWREYHLTDKGRALVRKIGKNFAKGGE